MTPQTPNPYNPSFPRLRNKRVTIWPEPEPFRTLSQRFEPKSAMRGSRCVCEVFGTVYHGSLLARQGHRYPRETGAAARLRQSGALFEYPGYPEYPAWPEYPKYPNTPDSPEHLEYSGHPSIPSTPSSSSISITPSAPSGPCSPSTLPQLPGVSQVFQAFRLPRVL